MLQGNKRTQYNSEETPKTSDAGKLEYERKK